MAESEPKGKGEKKTAIELDALNQEIIKRDNKFYSLNKNFHLDLKTRISYILYISYIYSFKI